MKKKFIPLLALVLLCNTALDQENYYTKIKAVTDEALTATALLAKLDSIKLTRQPSTSGIRVLVSRSIDFGYLHKRIAVRYNSEEYHIDLVTKNDSIYFSKAQYGNPIFLDSNAININKKLPYKADTLHLVKFLAQRNKFYRSVKTIKEAVEELCANVEYALNCGDGNTITEQYKQIITWAKVNNRTQFGKWLSSLNCEEQAYAALGYKLLVKNKFRVNEPTLGLVKHINQRQSVIIQCQGCLILTDRSH